MSLDKENNNVGYRLGRLFAVLEKIQQEASPGINATIRDRFYSAASATPRLRNSASAASRMRPSISARASISSGRKSRVPRGRCSILINSVPSGYLCFRGALPRARSSVDSVVQIRSRSTRPWR